jgi:hypothetical protein
MGQVLHGSATTTPAVRRAIQHSQESLEGGCEALRREPEDDRQVESADLGFRCRRDRKSADRLSCQLKMTPVIVALPRHTLRPFDDCLYALQLTIPHLDALVPSPVSATPRGLPVAAGRRHGLHQTQIQGLSIATRLGNAPGT